MQESGLVESVSTILQGFFELELRVLRDQDFRGLGWVQASRFTLWGLGSRVSSRGYRYLT